MPSREMGLDLEYPESVFMGLSGKIRARDASDTKYNDDSFYGEPSFLTHTSILRVCRQIYIEAASVFYSELTIIVEPGDIIQLWWQPDIVRPNKKVWRYNPLKGTGNRQDNGTVRYEQSEMDGRMEPHIFARFQKVELSMDLDWSLGEMHINLDADYNVHSNDAADFTAGLQKSTFLGGFVAVLSNTPFVRHLTVSLGIDIMAYYDDEDSLTSGSDGDQDSDTDSHVDLDSDSGADQDLPEFPALPPISAVSGPSEPQNVQLQPHSDITHQFDVLKNLTQSEREADRRDMIRDAKANERAIEMFLDSGILDPLRKISNVETFSLNFDHMFTVSLDNYKPLARHVKMIRDLKSTIEGNFRVDSSKVSPNAPV